LGSSRHLAQLDGVRALAIGLVLVAHAAPLHSRLSLIGEIGVRIFFVLSGFLITGILLKVRAGSLETGQSLWISLRQFYLRRALRIFPVFYLALAAGVAGGLLKYPDALPWMVAYVGNWYTVIYGRTFGWLNPFWTLWIEEQFYLIWPLLVLYVPRRFTLPGAIGIVALSVAYRLVAYLTGVPFWAIYENTVTSLDALVLGAILAMLGNRRLAVYGWVALPVMTICFGFATRLGDVFVTPMATAFLGVALVERAARGGRWMSYGLYAYQEIVHGLLIKAAQSLGHVWTDFGWIRTPFVLVCALAVTAASYYGMERPLSRRYKRRIPYILKAAE
jgi:peptidoglycan/LPS O-acetylase OafA/YrhL